MRLALDRRGDRAGGIGPGTMPRSISTRTISTIAGWDTDFEVTIPDGMASGVYGVRLRCGGEQDIVPIYVLPPAGVTTAPIVFLASTFTYQIYGNHQRGNVDDAFRARQAEWGAYPWNAQDHPEYGASTYNTHADGSGICYSSQRRPLLDDAARLYHLFRLRAARGCGISRPTPI